MKSEQKLFEEWYVANYHDGDINPHNTLLDFDNYHGEYRDNLVNALWEAWQASTLRQGYKLVPVCDYNELVRSNRYRQEVNIKLNEEVKILRERKTFYKSELKKVNDNFKLLHLQPTEEMIKKAEHLYIVEMVDIFSAVLGAYNADNE